MKRKRRPTSASREPATVHGLRLMISVFLLLVGCGTAVAPTPVAFPTDAPLPTPTLATAAATAVPPTTDLAASLLDSTPSLPPPTPTPTPIPDTGWEAIRPGMEQRMIHLFETDGRVRERLTLLRLEPSLYEFRVAYTPGERQLLPDWLAQTGALLVVNGGYFTEDWEATGLTIVDRAPSGVSYGDFAGMLAVGETAVELRWLAQQPYDPAEPLLYGLQSFPLLVKPGGELGFPEETGRQARRTVIAQDGDGRVLFIIASRGSFTLHQISRYLTESDLALDIALNLDGGPSTGLILADPPLEIPAFSPLPAVITVHPR